MAMILLWTALVSAFAAAQSTFGPVRPPAIPLAVRSPYLSTWQAAGSDGGNGGYLAGQWPSFWTGATTGWTGMIRVDNKTYTWMGNPVPLPEVATQTSFDYTSTRSIFQFDVGGLVSMKVTFLSPLSPDDMLRQSAPVSYMAVIVQSTDGNEHDVQVYTDVSAEWASGDRSQNVEWSYGVAGGSATRRRNAKARRQESSENGTATADAAPAATGTQSAGGVAYHRFARQTQAEFSEVSDQGEWGNWYYATSNVNGLTHKSGSDNDVRGQFMNDGVLDNSEDSNYRAINDQYPTYGFSVNYGRVGSSSINSVFSMFHAQQNAVQFNTGSGLQPVPSFWREQYNDELDALSFFYKDFRNTFTNSVSLDDRVTQDANAAGGQDYLTIVSLGVRQAFGAMQVAGTSENPYVFMKEISSNGNMNTVDVIFPTSPILLYFSPKWLKLLIDPVYIVQENGLWPETFAIHDIGFHYPNGTGHANDATEEMPLEECGNMLILALAYAQKASDTAYLTQHYDLLKQWTGYLVDEALIPANQISTDDFAGALANQTNLALKGIIGIQAMSAIANLTGNDADGANYSSIAVDYIARWQDLAIARDDNPPHTTLSYGANDTHGLLYNLYADSLLQTNLVPTSVYEMQSTFYPTQDNTYGVPLDTRHGYSKNDWELWCAAISSDDTRGGFLSRVAKWIGETPTSGPASDWYDTTTGGYGSDVPFKARPVVGGWFSLLALKSIGIPS